MRFIHIALALASAWLLVSAAAFAAPMDKVLLKNGQIVHVYAGFPGKSREAPHGYGNTDGTIVDL